MDKPVVTPRRFVEMLNDRLRKHPLYREGMEVYAVPCHAEHPRSLVCVGPKGAVGVCSAVEAILRNEYDVEPDIPREWHFDVPPAGLNANRAHRGPHAPGA